MIFFFYIFFLIIWKFKQVWMQRYSTGPPLMVKLYLLLRGLCLQCINSLLYVINELSVCVQRLSAAKTVKSAQYDARSDISPLKYYDRTADETPRLQ